MTDVKVKVQIEGTQPFIDLLKILEEALLRLRDYDEEASIRLEEKASKVLEPIKNGLRPPAI